MPTLLQIDFPLDGPWGAEMTDAFDGLAHVIAEAPGLRWKVWTENRERGDGGGVYLFDDVPTAEAYLAEHTARLNGFGITEIRARIFDVNESLTATTRGPLD
jgi:hypothetical protein